MPPFLTRTLLWLAIACLTSVTKSSPLLESTVVLDKVPDHLLGVNQIAADLNDVFLADAILENGTPPGIPSDYNATDHVNQNDLHARFLGPFRAPDTYPFRTVGKVLIGRNTGTGAVQDYAISGFLVAANTIVISSRFAPWDKASWWIKFIPAYNGNEPWGNSYVESFYGYRPGSSIGHDYVVCKLFNAVGKSVGWMGSQYYTDLATYKSQPFFTLGYPDITGYNGRFMAEVDSISISNTIAETDSLRLQTPVWGADPGWLGGPLWHYQSNAPYAVGSASTWTTTNGISSAEYAGGMALVSIVQYAQTNWPA